MLEVAVDTFLLYVSYGLLLSMPAMYTVRAGGLVMLHSNHYISTVSEVGGCRGPDSYVRVAHPAQGLPHGSTTTSHHRPLTREGEGGRGGGGGGRGRQDVRDGE